MRVLSTQERVLITHLRYFNCFENIAWINDYDAKAYDIIQNNKNVILSILNKADFSLENALVTRIITILPYTDLTCNPPNNNSTSTHRKNFVSVIVLDRFWKGQVCKLASRNGNFFPRPIFCSLKQKVAALLHFTVVPLCFCVEVVAS